MLGVFDSGRGGVNTVRELIGLSGSEDVLLFCDRRNAPFGTKTKEEITEITEQGVERLLEMGARQVLIGCCTASSVHESLSDYVKGLSFPIIETSVLRALECGQRIAVLATDASVRSHRFSKEIEERGGVVTGEISGQYLVSAVESGECDGKISRITKKYIETLAENVRKQKADALILGCTHFPSFEKEFKKRLSGVAVISSARAGAEGLANKINFNKENKKITYISS